MRRKVFTSLLPLTVLCAALGLAALGCTNPGGGGPTPPATGDITGHARFSGQSDNSGILITAESVDASGKTLAVKRAIATRSVVADRSIAANATTDADGSYSLTGLAPGDYTIYASSQNSLEKAVTTGVTVVAGTSVTAGDLNLTPTGSIGGKATLNSATSGNLGIVVCIAGTSYLATTDNSGAFTISSVPAATSGYTLQAMKNGYNTATKSGVVVTAGATPADAGTLNLTPIAGVVSGTARLGSVYSQNGNTGISVFLAGTSYSTTTNDAGAFSLTGVAPGSYTLMATRDGYLPATVSSVTVTAGGTYSVQMFSLGPQMAVETIAGSPGLTGSTDATGSAARFWSPRGIATDGYNLYVADFSNYTVRRVVISTGVVSTLAGSAGWFGNVDGTGSGARFGNVQGVAYDGSNLYVTDSYYHVIRKITSGGVVTTWAGTVGTAGAVDDIGTAAQFNTPMGITYANGFLYVADYGNHTIRQIPTSSANVVTLAGSAGFSGSTDATGSDARFKNPSGVVSDGTNLYVADYLNHTIRKIVISSKVVTTLAGTAGSSGAVDGTGSAARFNRPFNLALYSYYGYLYVTDYYNNTIRRIVASTGEVTTVAGLAGVYGSFDGMGNDARFNYPLGITATSSGIVYLTDSGNDTIRRIR